MRAIPTLRSPEVGKVVSILMVVDEVDKLKVSSAKVCLATCAPKTSFTFICDLFVACQVA